MVVSALNLHRGGEKKKSFPVLNGSAAERRQLCTGRLVTAVRRWRTKPFYARENYAKCALLEVLQVQAVSICSSAVL